MKQRVLVAKDDHALRHAPLRGLRDEDFAPAPAADDAAAAGDLLLDPAQHTCTVAGVPVDLTPTGFRLPAVLIAAAGGLLTRRALVRGRPGERHLGPHGPRRGGAR
ncbi:hypothetical protein [Streptomyces lavendulae]|uniref:hypothetical protein n=1 Tax=Streptomyces lavendulae TaxID=1914 RepID=UPI0031EB30E4